MVNIQDRHLDNDETNEAAWMAARGAVAGAARWGIYGMVLAGLGYAFSPIYRGLTFQFKVFIQMCPMTLGSMIEADQRLRAHEMFVRRDKQLKRDAEVWRRYQDEYMRKAVAEQRIENARGEDGK
ncbi:hypothetical protein K461DRAFT_318152 [Myriangium duriaei CBS 260.36]|uniref:Imidazoleglycerol-phosphate dehydratase n=1 Tax=Myriangium duriaei CBS 260.36 TaxID=1168546 RepID=A0A9P4MT58_9PEZI|nr:hypothetical protein K461DRAFT_318152 [Myriangium duriaei CBS 260.36]